MKYLIWLACFLFHVVANAQASFISFTEPEVSDLVRGLREDRARVIRQIMAPSQDPLARYLQAMLAGRIVCAIDSSFAQSTCQLLHSNYLSVKRRVPRLLDFPVHRDTEKRVVARTMAALVQAAIQLGGGPDPVLTLALQGLQSLQESSVPVDLSFLFGNIELKLRERVSPKTELAIYIPVLDEIYEWLARRPVRALYTLFWPYNQARLYKGVLYTWDYGQVPNQRQVERPDFAEGIGRVVSEIAPPVIHKGLFAERSNARNPLDSWTSSCVGLDRHGCPERQRVLQLLFIAGRKERVVQALDGALSLDGYSKPNVGLEYVVGNEMAQCGVGADGLSCMWNGKVSRPLANATPMQIVVEESQFCALHAEGGEWSCFGKRIVSNRREYKNARLELSPLNSPLVSIISNTSERLWLKPFPFPLDLSAIYGISDFTSILPLESGGLYAKNRKDQLFIRSTSSRDRLPSGGYGRNEFEQAWPPKLSKDELSEELIVIGSNDNNIRRFDLAFVDGVYRKLLHAPSQIRAFYGNGCYRTSNQLVCGEKSYTIPEKGALQLFKLEGRKLDFCFKAGDSLRCVLVWEGFVGIDFELPKGAEVRASTKYVCYSLGRGEWKCPDWNRAGGMHLDFRGCQAQFWGRERIGAQCGSKVRAWTPVGGYREYEGRQLMGVLRDRDGICFRDNDSVHCLGWWGNLESVRIWPASLSSSKPILKIVDSSNGTKAICIEGQPQCPVFASGQEFSPKLNLSPIREFPMTPRRHQKLLCFGENEVCAKTVTPMNELAETMVYTAIWPHWRDRPCVENSLNEFSCAMRDQGSYAPYPNWTTVRVEGRGLDFGNTNQFRSSSALYGSEESVRCHAQPFGCDAVIFYGTSISLRRLPVPDRAKGAEWVKVMPEMICAYATTLVCWKYGSDEKIAKTYFPKIGGPIKNIVAGRYHICVQTDSDLDCFGRLTDDGGLLPPAQAYDFGQTRVPSELQRVAIVNAGETVTCVTTHGSSAVTCFGAWSE